MDDDEKEVLHRLDERTANISEVIRRMEARQRANSKQIRANTTRSKKNETKLNTGGFVIGAGITALFTKVAGILPW